MNDDTKKANEYLAEMRKRKIAQIKAQLKESRQELKRIKESGSTTGYAIILKEEISFLEEKLARNVEKL